MFTFWLGAILLFTVPPIGFVVLMYWFFAKEPRDEKEKARRRRLQAVNYANILNSHPGPCPQCGQETWDRGLMRLVPSGAFRVMGLWPTGGTVSVTNFTCSTCGSTGRYGMCHEAADRGWVLLDRYAGGW